MSNDQLIKHLQNTIENQRLIIEGLKKENRVNNLVALAFIIANISLSAYFLIR